MTPKATLRSPRRPFRRATIGLLGCGLLAAVLGVAGADEMPAAPETTAAPAPDAPTPASNAANMRRAARMQATTSQDWLSKRLALYKKMLDLDPKQEVALRQLLVEQREAIQRIWADKKLLPAERAPATRAVEERTGDRIREMLTDEQKKKYNPPKPPPPPTPDSGAPNVEAWMMRTRQK